MTDREALNFVSRLDDMFFRQSGRTVNNIVTCPRNSIYVCHSDMEQRYCRDVAMVNARTDIKFVGPSFIRGERYRGLRPEHNPIVFDHATRLTESEWDYFMAVYR